MLPFNVYGLTTFRGDRATIWLNAEAWPELPALVPRTIFTTAHECFHALAHRHEKSGGSEMLESEANRFAAHLLIPDAALQALPEATEADLVARFMVSTSTARKRLAEWRKKSL